MIDPNKDGIDHINIYSKGKTELGRFLTNFSRTLIKTEDGYFSSVEGYWYWLSCPDERLRTVHGFEAKKLGRELGAKDWSNDITFKDKIKKAIDYKLKMHCEFKDELQNCRLPLKHYYVYGNKIIEPKDGQWILDHLESYKLHE